MTLYLTDNTPPEEIARAKLSGRVYGVKLYPAGATTNSDAGVTRISRCFHDARERWQQHGPAAAGARRGRPTRRSTCSTARRCSSSEVLGPLRRALPRAQGRARAHHHARGGAVRRGHRPERRRHHHRAPPADEPQRALRGRHPPAPLLPAGAQARGAPRGAGRGGDLGQPEVLPRHRQRAARAQHEGGRLRLRRHLHRARRDRALRRCVRGSRRARQARGLREPTSARDFYGLPRNDATRSRCVREDWNVPRDPALRRRASWCRCARARRFPGSSST